MNFVTKNLISPFGIPKIHYDHSARFSNEVEQFGVVPVSIECLPNGQPGFRLECCSSERLYEVIVERSRVRLSMSTPNTPTQHLGQGGAANESTWRRFIQTIRTWEDR